LRYLQAGVEIDLEFFPISSKENKQILDIKGQIIKWQTK
jgi:hypothetical protein